MGSPVKKSKRDFGSFHSSNVQELISCPEKHYLPPSFPIEFPKFVKKPCLGKACRAEYFLLEDSCVFINHGAFGAVLSPALDYAQKWQKYIEKQPLRFFDRELLPHLVFVTRKLAKFVGCDAGDIVLISNVTTGINSVIRSIKLAPKDKIYTLSVAYGAVKKLLKAVAMETGCVVEEIQIQFPIKDKDQIISLVNETLGEDFKLAIFDHIPSNTPFIMPLKEIIHICKKRGVPVLVDGAHALGSQPLNLHDLDPDYYVSNAHKWFCCPKGSAFMYVRKSLQDKTRPLIISHGYGSGFNSEFIWSGLHDYSAFLAMHVAMDFWNNYGASALYDEIQTLCHKACEILKNTWKTRLAAPLQMFGSMGLVQLPDLNIGEKTYSHAESVQNILYHKFNIEVPIKCVQGELFVRISAHIYNTLEEYHTLAQSVLEIKDDLQHFNYDIISMAQSCSSN